MQKSQYSSSPDDFGSHSAENERSTHRNYASKKSETESLRSRNIRMRKMNDITVNSMLDNIQKQEKKKESKYDNIIVNSSSESKSNSQCARSAKSFSDLAQNAR